MSLVSGKSVLSQLSSWSKAEFGVSFGAGTLVGEMHVNDLADEVVDVIRAIDATCDFGVSGAHR